MGFPPEVIRLRPAADFRLGCLLLHLAAAVAVSVSALPAGAAALLLTAIVLSGWRTDAQHGRRALSGSIVAIRFGESLEICRRGAGWQSARLLDFSLSGRWLLVARLDAGARLVLLMTPGMLEPEQWRRLRVWLSGWRESQVQRDSQR